MSLKSSPIIWLADEEPARKVSGCDATSCTRRARTVWSSLQGVGSALLSGILFAFVALLFQFLGQSGIPHLQVIFIADLGMTLALIPPLLYFRVNLKADSLKDALILVSIGVIWTSGYVALLNSLSRLPMSNVIAIIHGAMPILTPLMSCMFLREFCSCVDAVGTVINLVGIVFITQPTFLFGENRETAGANEYPIGYLYAFLCAFAFSVICVFARFVGQRVSLLMLSFYKVAIGAASAFILCLIFEPRVWKPQTPVILSFLIMILANTLGTWLRFYSLQLEAAATVVLLANIQLAMAYVLDFVIYEEKPTAIDLIGAFLIIFSSAIVAGYTWYRHVKLEKQEEDDHEYSFLYSDVDQTR
ncbi:solute carrier family 35 member G1-like [Ptychodera flava]|uniref:solute carrier family 35 member G1-like n=1 Tax=Ptychodera flava TaxID=63121 RepID=UPI00396A0DE0